MPPSTWAGSAAGARPSAWMRPRPATPDLIRIARRPTRPDAGLERADLRTALDQALASLSEVQRQTFVLYADGELSYREIAEAMRTSIGTVMSRLFYARQKLRRFLERTRSRYESRSGRPPTTAQERTTRREADLLRLTKSVAKPPLPAGAGRGCLACRPHAHVHSSLEGEVRRKRSRRPLWGILGLTAAAILAVFLAFLVDDQRAGRRRREPRKRFPLPRPAT